jgi:hypothetical protein
MAVVRKNMRVAVAARLWREDGSKQNGHFGASQTEFGSAVRRGYVLKKIVKFS